MSGPGHSENQPIPVIRPGGRSVAARRDDAAPEHRSASTLRWLTLGLLGLVLATLLGVIFVLPNLVAERQAEVDRTPPTSPATAPETLPTQPAPTASEDAKQLARDKREAEGQLGTLLRKQAELESQGVATWGGGDYEAVLDTLAAGDTEFQARSFAKAVVHYSDAIAGLEAIQASKDDRLRRALDAGERALVQGDGPGARKHFTMALAISPNDEGARRGMARGEVVEEVAELVSAGAAHEARDELEEAQSNYQAALALDPGSAEAGSALVRVSAELVERAFRAAMSAALITLDSGDFSASRAALQRAKALKPGAPEVADTEKRLRLAVQRSRIDAHRKKALAFAAEELWREAADQYAAVLAIDANAAFAKVGLSRSLERARIHAEMDAFLANPERLADAKPRASARRLLEVATTVAGDGEPLLAKKTRQLDRALELAEAPMRVLLQSDNLTDVVVYKVGRFGKFTSHALTLKPGRYVVVGSRAGYRDVRVEFSVMPGEEVAPVLVRCEERI